MKRWWIIPALAGILALAGTTYWGYNTTKDKKQLMTYLNNRNQRAFFELIEHVQNSEVMLSKGIISNSNKQRMTIFSDIWQQTSAAQENLTQVPMSGPSMTRTSKFLTQTGDFTWSMAKKYARGEEPKPEELTRLNELHAQAGYLAAELMQIEKSASKGRISWDEIKGGTNNLGKQAATIPTGLQKLDKRMENFPTLIYDGPFSDSITNRKPLGLTGPMITRSQAENIARKAVETGSALKVKVVRTDSVNGTIKAFRVNMTPQKGASPVIIVDVSKKGGHVLSVINTRPIGQVRIPSAKVITTASKYLADRKLSNMEPTYVVEQRNTAVIIYEYKQNNILIYPDLVKVKVALDNGEVLGYEATQFVMNHHVRKLPKPKVSEQEAAKKVNPQLKIESKRLAVIPLENLHEVLVYEFKGDLKGDKFIVYIDAQTGQEERILKVIDTMGGPVTM